MLTKSMRVRPAFPDDLHVVREIAAANGMPDYRWPAHAWGTLAVLDDRTVAFMVGRDITRGIFVEDFWAVHDADGARGLAKLSEWLTQTSECAARDNGGEIMVAVAVMLDNKRQRNVMLRRGYEPYADILAKKVSVPRG
jgi:hypothetical protein